VFDDSICELLILKTFFLKKIPTLEPAGVPSFGLAVFSSGA
jgi:hypothetical protein